jgi:hypothetical protein
MKYRKLRIAFSAVCGVICLLLPGCDSDRRTQSTSGPPKVQNSGQRELQRPTDRAAVSIPLGSVVSTSRQPELQHAQQGTNERGYVVPYGNFLDQLHRGDGGASNIYLVDAPTITGAVQVSTRVSAGAHTADWPATLNMPDPPRGNYWLVVFLGIRGSSPDHWLVDSVTVEGNLVRFNYHSRGPSPETDDIHHYYYWIPLGALTSGAYNLELFDTELKAVTLMRRVEVKAPGER